MSHFEHFLEMLEHVSPECERNYTLLTDLDKRTLKCYSDIMELHKTYKSDKSKSSREATRKKLTELSKQMMSLSDEKVALATQTYELVDKNIQHMSKFTQELIESSGGLQQATYLGYRMPVAEDEPRFCTCNQVSHDTMIQCDNRYCANEWFHLTCVKLTKAPKGKWFCSDECRQAHKKSG